MLQCAPYLGKTTIMMITIYRFVASVSLFLLASFSIFAADQSQTQVIMLGTGTPIPDPNRSGPSVAIITNGEAYVFDAGGGMVNRTVQASQQYNMPELFPQDIKHLFLTHLHSDHIHDVSELAMHRWWGRPQRLSVYGPKGIAEYTEHMASMIAIEADIRAAGTPEQLVTDRHGYLVNATEIEEGIVFSNDDITVEAFTVPHGEIRPAFGYKITTADKTIVISGDTAYSELLIEKAAGVDLLIHEVFSGDRLNEQSEFWQQYHGSSHTSASQIAQIANIARPGLVVLTHILFFNATSDEIVAEVKRSYDGEVVMADDLDMF